jgi:antitoxin component of RelBE/YafQ-DinJ toxin-antitoxin module
MVLGFGSRDSTRDIDALLISPASIRAAIQRVAEQENLPTSWLNDGAKGFASNQPVEIRQLLKMSHLRIVAPPAEYILAMKCISARVGIDENDKADTKFLIQHLKLRDSAAVLAVVSKYYNEKRIPAKTRYFIQEICDELSRPPQDTK